MAVEHSILTALWHMLADGECYADPGTGIGGAEPACIEVETPQMVVEVHMEPFAARLP